MMKRITFALGLLILASSACSKAETKSAPGTAPSEPQAPAPQTPSTEQPVPVDKPPTPATPAQPNGPTPSTGAIPTAKQAKVPALASAIVEVSNKSGLVTMARLLMNHSTAQDGIAVALRWEDPQGILTLPRGTKQFGWADTLAGLEVSIQAPGKAWRVLKASGTKPGPTAGLMPSVMSPVARFDNQGIHVWGRSFPWQKSVPPLGAPGTYKLKLRGSIGAKASPTIFETGTLSFELKAPSATYKTLAQLQAIGLAQVQALGLGTNKRPPGFDRQVVEDKAGNRVLRFYVGTATHRYQNTVVELVLSPAGKILAMDTLAYFTCVAEGTQIDTATGPRAVESVQPGDRVWSYDPETRTRHLTTVTASHRHATSALIQIGDRLRTTASHPIYVDGAWVPAGDLTSSTNVMTAGLRTKHFAVRRLAAAAVVYDLSVEWPHNFFADDVLVHNKAAQADWRDGKAWKPWVRAADQPGANRKRPPSP